MSLRNIGIVYRKELTEALRDRRTLITTFLVPLLMIPVLGAGFTGVMSAVIGSAKKEKASVAIIGGDDSPAAYRRKSIDFVCDHLLPGWYLFASLGSGRRAL